MDESDVSEVIPGLWIGNVKSALNEQYREKRNISYIVDTTNKLNALNKLNYLNITVKDKNDNCYDNLTEIYDRTSNFIYEGMKKKKGVLVVCERNYHVSASIVVAFLFKYLHIDYLSGIVYMNSIKKESIVNNSCLLAGLFKYYTNVKYPPK